MIGAAKRYRQFHGRSPRRVKKFDFHLPRQLVILGKAVAIEYQCDKLHGGGDGKRAVYRHEFKKPAIVCMDERGRRQLYVLGGKISVTQRGIIN